MTKAKNVLWIMVDQLRWDYLSCYGATHIETPHLDRLASKGMLFNKAYVQSPICGPSRMSFYTGRYVRSHGSCWNGFPLRIGEPTLGDHLREVGVTSTLVGKTHMTPDFEGMKRLGISTESAIGALIVEGGFETFIRDDGNNHTDYPGRNAQDYDGYLREHGFEGDNLWEEWANTAEDTDGTMRTGWLLENSRMAVRVPAEHSETAWLTTKCIEFIEQQEQDKPWLCHLSYIKPHWPYIAPAPYNDMYGPDDLPPVARSEAERSTDHPIMQAWMDMRVSKTFARDDVRDVVAPAYMGLIKQIDDEMGRLFAYLESTGRFKDTMIVFCSDHGDNMGDHWIGEKDLFYDCSARIPLIIYDPSADADATRGTVSDELVEGIDLTATFMDVLGVPAKPHIVEGRSLKPLLNNTADTWREFAFSEYDYATRESCDTLGIDQKDARLTMVFDGRWKYTHAEKYRPMLFDLENDPDELVDLAPDPAYADQLERLSQAHFDWARGHHNRITRTAEQVDKMRQNKEPPGVLIGYWDKAELLKDGKKLPPHTVG